MDKKKINHQKAKKINERRFSAALHNAAGYVPHQNGSGSDLGQLPNEISYRRNSVATAPVLIQLLASTFFTFCDSPFSRPF